MRMAAATSFFTTFALPPILIILIQLFGLFIDPKMLSSELIGRLANIIGNTSAMQIETTLENFRNLSQNWYATLLGFIFLMFVATTLFAVIKDSLDQIWNIQLRPHPGIWFKLKQRARSMAVILLAGFLFFAGLLTEGLKVFLVDHVEDAWPGAGVFFAVFANEVIFMLVATIWFSILFRYLTDGRPATRMALAGGLFTAILFTSGKLIIRWLMSFSKIGTIYGASGSIVLVLLFVFYSSFIFYYGGCFIRILSEAKKQPIRPIKEAFVYEVNEVEVKERI